jgi:hypothetical protein
MGENPGETGSNHHVFPREDVPFDKDANTGARDENPGYAGDLGQGRQASPSKHRRHWASLVQGRDSAEYNEVTLNIRVSYKTLLLVFVVFDVAHRVVNVVVN